jgi:hypothetical protein
MKRFRENVAIVCFRVLFRHLLGGTSVRIILRTVPAKFSDDMVYKAVQWLQYFLAGEMFKRKDRSESLVQ